MIVLIVVTMIQKTKSGSISICEKIRMALLNCLGKIPTIPCQMGRLENIDCIPLVCNIVLDYNLSRERPSMALCCDQP